MNRLTYEQINSLPNHRLTQKLYYKKYPFCIRFSSWDYYDRKNFSERFLLHMLNARQIKKYVKTLNLEHKSRVDTHLALYLLDLESVSLIYEKYKDQIEIIESPLNETQKEVMLDDLNVIVKEKLFYNKYRYKINFGFRRNDVLILNTLFETCNDSLSLENYKYASNFLYYKNILDKIGTPTPGQQIGRLPYYGTASIYFKEYEDVCTFHFLFKNNIAKTHKIVLKKELDE